MEGKNEELEVRSSQANAVMRALHHSVVLKRKLLKKAKLCVINSTFLFILTGGDEFWEKTERVRSQMQVSEKS